MRNLKFIIAGLVLGLMASCAYGQTATYEQVTSKQVKGKLQEYISKSGEGFKVGDTIHIGKPSTNGNFDYIVMNAITTPIALDARGANSRVVIKQLRCWRGTMWVKTSKSTYMAYNLAIGNLDAALEAGEVQSSIMTRKQAIDKLMEAKDLLSIEMMSLEEYNKLKIELSPIIKS